MWVVTLESGDGSCRVTTVTHWVCLHLDLLSNETSYSRMATDYSITITFKSHNFEHSWFASIACIDTGITVKAT
jgi:hypothetical protein